MQLAHDNAVSQSAKAATITAQAALSADGGTAPTSELMTQPWAPTAEEIEEEAEAARNYQLRREEARKKKEAQQARELQRMLEERRVMEEELEALRGSRSSSRGYAEEVADKGANNNSSAGSTVAAAVAEVQSAMAKKMGRMKKKFEKKLAAAKEALEDLQEVSGLPAGCCGLGFILSDAFDLFVCAGLLLPAAAVHGGGSRAGEGHPTV